jgi:hypothetical protein
MGILNLPNFKIILIAGNEHDFQIQHGKSVIGNRSQAASRRLITETTPWANARPFYPSKTPQRAFGDG